MSRPLVIFALIFSLAIFAADKFRIPFIFFYSLAGLCLAGCLLSHKYSRRGFGIWLSLFILFCAASRMKGFHESIDQDILKSISHCRGCLYTVRGRVEGYPLFRHGSTSFVLRAREITGPQIAFKGSADILVRIAGGPELIYAQELVLKGGLSRPSSFRGQSRQSRRSYLANQGIFLLMQASYARGTGQPVSWLELARKTPYLIRKNMEGVFYKRVSPLAASIISAMVLGERRGIPWAVSHSMVRSGTVHILVVSGFNVGLIAFLAALFLKLFRLPRLARFYLVSFTIIIYCLITGGSTPVFRATLMSGIFIFALLNKREPDIFNSLAVAAVTILAINPRQLFDLGFQLSFASVLSLVYLFPKFSARLKTDKLKPRPIRLILEAGLVSFSAWLGTLGLVAYNFRILSPVTVLANLLVVPLASLVTFSGLSLVAADFGCPHLAPYFARSAELMVALLLQANNLALRIPAACLNLP